ncbi:hypothetical protein [Roseovarius sp. 2305UL8-3]|uniref:hypothetical protein n=1 Tax=Roseovarius conchicola TaxID=3121636 RepID=UPI0035286E72
MAGSVGKLGFRNVAERRSYMIDPVGFFVALVAAPIMVAGATFWILFIPVFALLFGGPIYLAAATPVLLWWLARHPPKVSEIAALGFTANLVICAGVYLFGLATGARDPSGTAMFYLLFGSVFAPLWSAVFAVLYRRMRRPFFAQFV